MISEKYNNLPLKSILHTRSSLEGIELDVVLFCSLEFLDILFSLEVLRPVVDLLFLLLAQDQIQIPKNIENEILHENVKHNKKAFSLKLL